MRSSVLGKISSILGILLVINLHKTCEEYETEIAERQEVHFVIFFYILPYHYSYCTVLGISRTMNFVIIYLHETSEGYDTEIVARQEVDFIHFI